MAGVARTFALHTGSGSSPVGWPARDPRRVVFLVFGKRFDHLFFNLFFLLFRNWYLTCRADLAWIDCMFACVLLRLFVGM